MRKALIAGGVIVVIAAFLVGFWPQWSQKRAVERELAAARATLAENQRRLSVCGLRNRLLTIVMAAQARNFGIAAEQAQRLTTDLDTLATTAEPALRAAFENARPKAKNIADIAQRLDPQVPEDLSRAASELAAMLGQLEQAPAGATATPR
jgi:hypothetical protein